jgi:DNA-binding MarR family transcriptional regulator
MISAQEQAVLRLIEHNPGFTKHQLGAGTRLMVPYPRMGRILDRFLELGYVQVARNTPTEKHGYFITDAGCDYLNNVERVTEMRR